MNIRKGAKANPMAKGIGRHKAAESKVRSARGVRTDSGMIKVTTKSDSVSARKSKVRRKDDNIRRDTTRKCMVRV